MHNETMLLPAADCTLPSFRHHKWGEPSHVWYYHDDGLNLLGMVCRYDTAEGKQIIPYTLWSTARAPDGIWQCRSWPAPRPLYGLDYLAAFPEAIVVVCEGEKAADAAQFLLPMPEYICITSPGGSNAVHKAGWHTIQNRKVMIWPDNDAPGEKYAHAVSAILRLKNNDVYIMPVPTDKPQGWDAADALAEGWQYA